MHGDVASVITLLLSIPSKDRKTVRAILTNGSFYNNAFTTGEVGHIPKNIHF